MSRKEKKYASLFSGGKDSTYALYLALKNQINVTHLVTMKTKKDSYMYHIPNIELTNLQSKSIGIPLIKKETTGDKKQEIEDLKQVLKKLNIDGIITGAVKSNYQKQRIDKICKDLKLELYSPLWHQKSEKLLQEIIKTGFHVIITGISAYGFDKSYLGRKLDQNLLNDLKKLNEDYEIHITGEGGEFETTVLNGPIFSKEIKIIESSKKWDEINYRGRMKINEAKLTKN